LIQNVKRTLSIRAKTAETRLLVLSREAFNRIVGTISGRLNQDHTKHRA